MKDTFMQHTHRLGNFALTLYDNSKDANVITMIMGVKLSSELITFLFSVAYQRGGEGVTSAGR